MTRRDELKCIHEPFGDAFYYGPERLSDRFADDEEARMTSGFSDSTYRTIFDRIEREGVEVRLFPISPYLCTRASFSQTLAQNTESTFDKPELPHSFNSLNAHAFLAPQV